MKKIKDIKLEKRKRLESINNILSVLLVIFSIITIHEFMMKSTLENGSEQERIKVSSIRK
jgi:hypothetical protein